MSFTNQPKWNLSDLLEKYTTSQMQKQQEILIKEQLKQKLDQLKAQQLGNFVPGQQPSMPPQEQSMPEDFQEYMRNGGGIHIDPSKKGTFKAQATRMGMSVQEAARHILANKEKYSGAMVKKANFARNFAKEEGGTINNPGFNALPKYVQDKILSNMEYGGDLQMPEYKNGGYTVRRSNDRKGKTHVVIGPDGTKKYFGDPNMGERSKSKHGKKAFYARHASNLKNNPYFRAYARATWAEGGELSEEELYESEMENLMETPEMEAMEYASPMDDDKKKRWWQFWKKEQPLTYEENLQNKIKDLDNLIYQEEMSIRAHERTRDPNGTLSYPGAMERSVQLRDNYQKQKKEIELMLKEPTAEEKANFYNNVDKFNNQVENVSNKKIKKQEYGGSMRMYPEGGIKNSASEPVMLPEVTVTPYSQFKSSFPGGENMTDAEAEILMNRMAQQNMMGTPNNMSISPDYRSESQKDIANQNYEYVYNPSLSQIGYGYLPLVAGSGNPFEIGNRMEQLRKIDVESKPGEAFIRKIMEVGVPATNEGLISGMIGSAVTSGLQRFMPTKVLPNLAPGMNLTKDAASQIANDIEKDEFLRNGVFSDLDRMKNRLYYRNSNKGALNKKDFYSDAELEDMFNQYENLVNSKADFEQKFPEDPATTVWNIFSNNNEREELFRNLYPNAKMPNFYSKHYFEPEIEKSMREIIPFNQQIQNKILPRSLRMMENGMDELLSSAKPFTQQANRWLPDFNDRKSLIDYVSEMRGGIGKPSLEKIQNMTTEELKNNANRILKKIDQEHWIRYAKDVSTPYQGIDAFQSLFPNKYGGQQMIKRADGSYSQRGLWDNIRANKGSGKEPTKEMLKQERKIKRNSK